jgi:hypothetical protein
MLRVRPVRPAHISNFEAWLLVVRFESTRKGDAERGPKIWLNSHEAKIRSIAPDDVVTVHTPRRRVLAELGIDDSLGQSAAAVRDVPGVAPSERIKVEKYEPEEAKNP